MSQFFASGGQNIRASTSASVLPMSIQGISFRMDWFDLLAVQGTLKSLLQHHSSKASILLLIVHQPHFFQTYPQGLVEGPSADSLGEKK